jgi:hypothetical protein
MENRFFATLGKIGGIGGVALGIFLLIFQGVLKQNLFSSGLSQDGVFYVIAALLLLTFGLAGIGLVAWLISTSNPGARTDPSSLLLLVLLIILLFGGTIYLLTLGAKERGTTPPPTPAPAPTPPPTPAPARKETRVCFGNGGGNNCLSGAQASYDCDFYRKIAPRLNDWLGEQFCTTVENGQKKVMPFTVSTYQDNGGGNCGWTGLTVTCNP